MKRTAKIVIPLVLSVTLFVLLLFIQNTISNNKVTKEVVIVKGDIAEGTLITKDNAKDYFQFVQVESSLVPKNAIVNKNDVFNKQTKRILRENEILISDDLCPSSYDPEMYEDPTKESFQLSNISYGLAGKLRPGQIIRIDTVDKTSHETINLTENAYVSKVYDANGVEVTSTDLETNALIIEVIVDKKELEQINEADDSGELIVSIAQGEIEEGD